MRIELSEQEHAELDRAQHGQGRVRHWRRYQAIRLVAQGQPPQVVAVAVGCRLASVDNWIAAWKRHGCAGLAEGRHGGRPRRLEAPAERAREALLPSAPAGGAAGERAREALLASDPQAHGEQATGWTVPLLRTHLARAGSAVSEHTVRRTLHRRGWRWKRPRYELGRPDPADAAKKGASWSR
jgi:transposase